MTKSPPISSFSYTDYKLTDLATSSRDRGFADHLKGLKWKEGHVQILPWVQLSDPKQFHTASAPRPRRLLIAEFRFVFVELFDYLLLVNVIHP